MIRIVRGDWIEIWWKVVLGRQGTHSDPLASLRDSIVIHSVRSDWKEICRKVVLRRQGTHSDPLASLEDSIVIDSVRRVVEGSKLVNGCNRVARVIFGSYCKRGGRIR